MFPHHITSISSFLEAGSVYQTEGEFILSNVDIVGHFRTVEGYQFRVPRLVTYYFTSDAEGFVSIEGPGDTPAGTIFTDLALNDGEWHKTVQNVTPDDWAGYLVVLLPDGVVSVALSLPGSES